MAVDRTVIDIDLIVIGDVHQLIARLHKARTLRQGLQQQELGHGQGHIHPLPRHRVTQRVHPQLPTLHDLGFFGFGDDFAADGILTTQQGTDTFDQQTLAERLLHIVVGTHSKAENFVDLIILGGQENHWHGGFLTKPLKQIHPVHARHLYVEHGHIRQFLVKGVQCRLTIVVGFHLEAFGFERDCDGRQDIPVVVDEGDLRHR